MRTEPDLPTSRLIEVLGDRYRIDVTDLTFVPYGIDSWSYVATSRDGSKVFVKLLRPVAGRELPPSDAPLLAALAAHGVPVPRPTPDRDGGFGTDLDGYRVQVLEYLDGQNLEDETAWPDPLYARVAAIVAAVHGSTPELRDVVERVERFELPFVPPFLANLAAIDAGGSLPADGAPSVAALRELLRPQTGELLTALDRLQALRDRAATRSSETVLCHTDIWGSNLLRSADGTLHLLDWNGALLGPPEADLFMFAGTDFFPADRFSWFLARYVSAFRRVALDAQTFGFYFHRRTLEDLAFFVDDIAAGHFEAMAPETMLRIVAENLAEVPRLEARIGHVAAILAEAHAAASG